MTFQVIYQGLVTCTGVLHKFVDNRATAVLAPYTSASLEEAGQGLGTCSLMNYLNLRFLRLVELVPTNTPAVENHSCT